MTLESEVRYRDREFWSGENQRYARPHHRLEKCARLVNKIGGNRDCDLLDVGCGPATLMRFLRSNIHYYGIDMALREPAPNLLEVDILQTPVAFGDHRFDIVVAQGLFEYMGQRQDEKMAEISQVLYPEGTFISSYVNFGHRSANGYSVYNNVQPISDFRRSLERHFTVERYLPTSYNWHHDEPTRPSGKLVNLYLDVNIPWFGPKLAVEYFFVCRPRSG